MWNATTEALPQLDSRPLVTPTLNLTLTQNCDRDPVGLPTVVRMEAKGSLTIEPLSLARLTITRNPTLILTRPNKKHTSY